MATLHQMPSVERRIVEKLQGNAMCIDCGVPNPEWASVSLGILFCLDCSGRHRGLGTHISFVRSVTMDSWTDQQLTIMKAGGNQNCKDFISKHGIDVHTASIKEKYDSPPAELYRQVLKARVEGRPEPKELPTPVQRNPHEERDWTNRPMQGFGSGPHPKEERRRQRRRITIGVVGSVVAVAAGMLLKKK